MAEREEELKNLLMRVKGKSDKASLKLNINKTKIMASSPIMEKAMAPHCSTPAWKIPWAEEAGRLQSMG